MDGPRSWTNAFFFCPQAAANAANNLSQNKKKDDAPPEQTPLEKMLLTAGPIRDDGTDKFFGLENVSCLT